MGECRTDVTAAIWKNKPNNEPRLIRFGQQTVLNRDRIVNAHIYTAYTCFVTLHYAFLVDKPTPMCFFKYMKWFVKIRTLSDSELILINVGGI